MKKPPASAPDYMHARYRDWVRSRLKNWDPREDHFPECYIPRHDGVKGDAVERIEDDSDDTASDD